MFSIGGIDLDSTFILAPLAGYSDLPFRELCRKFGAGLCVSEMISCHGLVYRQQKTLKMMAVSSEERPVSIQLFGAEPDIMGQAAAIAKEYSPDFLDINMGCPVRKVTKKGAGSALMRDPILASKIIEQVRNQSGLPVTVKFRAGVDSNNISAVQFGKMAEDSGAVALTVHGRTWAQGFAGFSDWQIIADVKENVSIPVIGNGDVLSYQDGERMISETGCDGVMIGRGALGNPWVFMKAGKPQRLDLILPTILLHLDLIEKYLDAERLLGAIKNHISRYFKGYSGSSYCRKTIFEATSFDDLKSKIVSFSEERH